MYGRYVSHYSSSLANIGDLGRLGVLRIRGRRVLTRAIFLEHRGAARRIGRGLGARLHQIGRVVDLGGKIALRGAAVIPRRLVFEEVAVHARADVLRPQPAWPRLRAYSRIADVDGGEVRPGRRVGLYDDARRRQAGC